MKKHFIQLALLLLSLSSLVAQNAFWNAVTLHNARQGDLGDELQRKSIAKDSFYLFPFSEPPDTSLLAELDKYLKDKGVTILQSSVTQAEAGLTSLSPTTLLIDGTARFLADRFREEATTLYLDRFRTRLEQDPIASQLLPKTTGFLTKTNLFDLKALGTNFKEAFEEDLIDLLGNLKQYLDQHEEADNDSYYALVFALDMCDQLLKGTHPVDVLNYLDFSYQHKPGFEAYYRVAHLINLLQFNLRARESEDDGSMSLNLRETPKEPVWVSFKDLRLLNTPQEIVYFMGLVYQQDTAFFADALNLNLEIVDVYDWTPGINQIEFLSSGSFRLNGASASTSAESNVQQNTQAFWENTILPCIDILQTIELTLQDRKLTPEEYISVFDTFLQLIQLGDQTVFNTENGSLADFVEISEKVVDVYQSIQTKSYAQLVTNGSWLIHRLLIENGTDARAAAAVLEVIQHYGTFMVDIVTAENSEEVKDAIKRNVTKFTYLDKRRSPLSFTVMAVPSLLGGIEEVMGGMAGGWHGVAAVSCPIGFDFSFNARKPIESAALTSFNPEYVSTSDGIKEPGKAVAGFYIGIFDLTAPFSYRLSGSNAGLPSDITLKQIFSPSLSFHYSFKDSPITLAIGWQRTPELRTIGGDAENVNRLLLRCSWDIPMVKLGAKR